MFVRTPYGPGEVIYLGASLAIVRVPGYLPRGVTHEDNPDRHYWFSRSAVDEFERIGGGP